MAMRRRLQAVAETKAFSEDIDAMLSPAEREAVVLEIAASPDGGDLIPGTGGLRKRRIPLSGRGKRGGARVITFFLGPAYPVYAVFLYAKNERENLSSGQIKMLRRLVTTIRKEAERK